MRPCSKARRPHTLHRLSEVFDLQSHSVHSDGALRPRDVVAAAADAGVELLALTDHDTVDGVDEAVIAGREHGIRVVPAIEISAIDERTELHVLGYLIDHHDRSLCERLRQFRADRSRRGESIAQALRELGFALDEDALRRRSAAGGSLGRPHLARAVVDHPANRDRLAEEGLLDPSAFLEAYLIEGRPAFRPRRRPPVAEAIAAIHDAGGVAVWAHPFWDACEPQQVLDRIDYFRSLGIDGVECFYPTHDRAQTELLADRCEQLGLLATGSSDFHGPEHREFSRFRAFSTFGRRAVLGPIA